MYKIVAYLAAVQGLDLEAKSQQAAEVASPFLDLWLIGDSEADLVDVGRVILLSSWGGIRQDNEVGVFTPSYLLFPDLLEKQRSAYLVKSKNQMAVLDDGRLVGSLYNPDLSALPCLFPYHTHGVVVGAQGLFMPTDTTSGLSDSAFSVYDVLAFCIDCNRYNSAGAITVYRQGDPKPVGLFARYNSPPFSLLVPPELVDKKMAYLHKRVAAYGEKRTDKLSLEFAIWASEQFKMRLVKLQDVLGDSIPLGDMTISLVEV